jgi:hypothetical protein
MPGRELFRITVRTPPPCFRRLALRGTTCAGTASHSPETPDAGEDVNVAEVGQARALQPAGQQAAGVARPGSDGAAWRTGADILHRVARKPRPD